MWDACIVAFSVHIPLACSCKPVTTMADALKEMAVAMRDHDKTVVKLAQNNTDHINTRLDKIEDQLESTTSLAKRAIFVGSIIIIAGALLMEALRSGWFVR